MFFNPLERILKKVTQQPEWETYREYYQISKCWHQVVNQKVSQNTKPLYIDRKTLYVATSSAVWAQELALQRYSLIKKLNSRLDFTLKDIRFSAARWHNKQQSEIVEIPLKEVNLTKLRKEKPENLTAEANNSDAKIAVKNWLQNMQKESQKLENCPQCQSLTPQSELKRWQVCRYCIAQKWHEEYRPSQKE